MAEVPSPDPAYVIGPPHQAQDWARERMKLGYRVRAIHSPERCRGLGRQPEVFVLDGAGSMRDFHEIMRVLAPTDPKLRWM